MTKKITYLAMFMTLQILLSFFFVNVSENLRIYFTYLIVMILAIAYPLKILIPYAIMEDLLAFFLYPTGPFFVGYTLTALSGIVIYRLFLKDEVTLVKIILAKLSVNVFCNIFLNSLWSAILYSKGFIFYFTTSIIKNLALLPIEIILFVLFYNLVFPLLKRAELVDDTRKLIMKKS